MDLHQLFILRELGERGSVAAVARALFVSSSAVSQQLSALQRSTGVALTERRGRRLVLTPAGTALATAAASVSTAMAAAEQSVAHFHEEPAAPVSLSAFHSAGLAWFGPLISRLASPAGPTGTPIRCGDEDVARQDFPALVADYDLVIAHRLPHDPLWPQRVTVTPLLYEPLDVALHVGHPLAGRSSVSVADIADEPWIAGHPGFPLAEAVNVVAASAGHPLRIEHRINEFFVAASVVASGSAIALLPRYTMAPAPGSGLVLLPIDDLRVGRQIDVLSRPETLLRASVRRVLGELRAVAGSRTE
ncbi:LysR family transcriptional regulator [Cryobacterium sp. TMT1-62]|uniref:LysR family transcriptional regulator n=1 Tax=unclassified Cryobacterium TaxID=2649013 RepID=UPI00106B87B1|nr:MULTISPECIES: LysR family transcriptional regulator [unclassified Cryobacterium]TFC53827.1 LysR family transcriptional regulator [Cryobacterium sp. TMT2-17-1]TFC69961.1 LysR family transcriptional regulator [Cryobacterium sp. TMT2-4]TFD33792.1 LysR family transcriptional regulator [Cryobacterium sp. TMT1-62]